jgi:hypothetical protein
MKFEEAIKLLKKDKLISRKSSFILQGPICLNRFKNRVDQVVYGPNEIKMIDYAITYEDVIAEDWEEATDAV